MSLTTENVHQQLLHDATRGRKLTDDEVLLWMILLHTHDIHLREPFLFDAPGVQELGAVTQRQAATVVAALWPNRSDERSHYAFWYRAYQTAPYESIGDVPLNVRSRLSELRDILGRDPRVAAIVEAQD